MKIICLLIIFPVYVFGQSTFVLPKDIESKGYTQSIAEYVKAIYAKDKTSFDTLFIGKHEGFLDIDLPSIIQNTKIVLLTSEAAEKKFRYRKSFTYINIIGDFTKDFSFFKLIVFKTEKTPEKNNWWPVHNFIVDFNYNLKTKVFALDKVKFEYPYSNKYTEK